MSAMCLPFYLAELFEIGFKSKDVVVTLFSLLKLLLCFMRSGQTMMASPKGLLSGVKVLA